MLKYIAKRVLLFIPTIILISIFTFYLSCNSPGDPVQRELEKGLLSGQVQNSSSLDHEAAYSSLRKSMGFNKPLFYLSITNLTTPDSLHLIDNPLHREWIERLSFETGNPFLVSKLFTSLRNYESILRSDLREKNIESLSVIFQIFNKGTLDNVSSQIQKLLGNSFRPVAALSVKESFHTLVSNQQKWKKFVPAFHFYGLDNRFHKWISAFFSGDFGTSYKDGRKVSDIIFEALPITLLYCITAIVLCYLISIPLGVFSASARGLLSDKIISMSLFSIYSLPTFWIGTLLIIFFAGSEYYSIFPPPGSEPVPSDAPLWYRIQQSFLGMILPLVCWVYPSLAFLTRHMRSSMVISLSTEYIQTARAKGLSEKKVLWKHAFRSSLLPMIVVFASVFPAAISGSFILEFIFQIPGMGKISYESLIDKNYPVIFSVVMLTAFLTVLGNLVADILYHVADPRISFSKEINK